ncbi:MAG: DUF5675 family protein [Candidatus Woesearchaeota archaeon]
MNLYVLRNLYTDHSTRGILIIDNQRFCYTLEDVVRPRLSPKVPGKTAIPADRYEIVINFSNRFKRQMPLLLNVPNFSGIRIHGGNTAENTEGCILVAYNILADDKIQGTAEADITKLLQSKPGEKHWIEIIDTYPWVGTET